MKCVVGLTAIILHANWAVTGSALTVSNNSHVLRVFGDKRNDLIEIVDHGAGSLSVNGTQYHGVKRLVVDAGGGNDTITYDTQDILSVSEIQIELGTGDDIAEFSLGTITAHVQSEVRGGAGGDAISTLFGEVLASVNAESLMEGEVGDDVISCAQYNVAGSATCISNGGAGDDHIFCHAETILSGGQAECLPDGGPGNDTIACAKASVAGFASCVSDGGAGHDVLSCVLEAMTETGSGLCDQSGGPGNDTLTCETRDIEGQHVCFGDGGTGNDVVNSIVKGSNRPDSECTLLGGAGDDELNIELGTAASPITVSTGPVLFYADAGLGNDHFVTTANLTDESDLTISDVTVLLGRGDDTATLNFLSLGAGEIVEAVYDGGKGVDTYAGTLPADFLPLVDFELGV
jgi:hypothetical protein